MINVTAIKNNFLATAAVLATPVSLTLREKLFAAFDSAHANGVSILEVGHGLTTEASLASYRAYWRKARGVAVVRKTA